jgi:hypothetical protein
MSTLKKMIIPASARSSPIQAPTTFSFLRFMVGRALHFSFSTLIVYWFTIDGSVMSSRIMKKEAKICYVKID